MSERKVSWWNRFLCFTLGHRLSNLTWPRPDGTEQRAFSNRFGICLRCNTITHPRGDRV